MKTKEAILKDLQIYPGFPSTYTYDGILKAMETYAQQANGKLVDKFEEAVMLMIIDSDPLSESKTEK